MKITKRSLAMVATCVLSSAVGITTITSIDSDVHTASALSYGTSNDISFTFAPTLSIGLSTDSLTIDNLVPGTTSDSNTVTVTVSSNTPYGYVLSAGVGSNDTTSPYYNTSSLTHENSTISNVFSSVDTNASLDSLDTDNTWGYSTSTNGGTSWSTYSGLSHTATKPLLDISGPAQPSAIDFKIAARSASTQASGTYSNVITFYAVGKPEPVYYMQDTATIKAELQNVGDEMRVVDVRDGKKYWIAKQADGNIWMTQNLDLCIGCEGTTVLNSGNTDLNVSGSGAYIDGYTNIDGIITWNPSTTAITSNHLITDTNVSGWANSTNAPYSAEGGDIYIYTSGSSDADILYNSLSQCTGAGHNLDDCSHYSVGNYYNWNVAIASNDSSGFTGRYLDASNSICPAGWKMPKGASNNLASDTQRDYKNLFYPAGVVTSLGRSTYTTNGFNILRSSTLYFVRSGQIGEENYLKLHRYEGYYWTKTNWSTNSKAVGSTFSKTLLRNTVVFDHGLGHSIRCLVK